MTTNALTLLSEVRSAVQSGEAVKLREAAMLTQGELARAIGVSAAAVCRWESGRRRPSGDAALRYGRMLRVLATVIERERNGGP
jgi:DNA-binding transcriptional regulator YiaG